MVACCKIGGLDEDEPEVVRKHNNISRSHNEMGKTFVNFYKRNELYINQHHLDVTRWSYQKHNRLYLHSLESFEIHKRLLCWNSILVTTDLWDAKLIFLSHAKRNSSQRTYVITSSCYQTKTLSPITKMSWKITFTHFQITRQKTVCLSAFFVNSALKIHSYRPRFCPLGYHQHQM